MKEFSYEGLKDWTKQAGSAVSIDLSGQDVHYVLERISYHIAASEDELNARKWTLLGLEVMEKLDLHSEGDQLTGMNFRLNYLLKWGDQNKDAQLSPAIVVNWTFSIIDMSAAELRQLAQAGQNPDLEQIKALRRIKNRLKLCDELKKRNLYSFSDAQNEYLTVRSFLP